MVDTLEALHEPDWYLEHFVAEAERFASAVEHGPLDADVAACADWDVADLTAHLGGVHRWANFCAVHARPRTPDDPPMEAFDPARAAEWYRAGAAELLTTLRSLDPDAPTWHPFPVDQIAAVWPRRQAHETAIHRWDVQQAVAEPEPIDRELASDGIDEYFGLVVPRRIRRDGIDVPAGSFHVHCTDVDGEWLVWNEGGDYRVRRVHQKGDAALRGPAEAILLRLWARESSRADELSPVGDQTTLDAWLSIGGM